MSEEEDPKDADELLEDLREKVKEGIDNTLEYAEKLVKTPDELTTKDLADATFNYVMKSGSITVEAYRSAYRLFFPKKDD